jgi:hypothetical protein
MLWVVDINLDSIDEGDTFSVRLHALGCEFGLRRDERDASAVTFSGPGIGGNHSGLAPNRLTEISLVQVSAQPDVIEVSQRDNRSAGLYRFTKLRVANHNHA